MGDSNEEILMLRSMEAGKFTQGDITETMRMVENAIIDHAGKPPKPCELIITVKRAFLTLALLLALPCAMMAAQRAKAPAKPCARETRIQTVSARTARSSHNQRYLIANDYVGRAPEPVKAQGDPTPGCQPGPYLPYEPVNDGCSPILDPVTGAFLGVGPDCGKCQ